ncbi:MAG: hypothetical protein R6X12_06800 [bacterium]
MAEMMALAGRFQSGELIAAFRELATAGYRAGYGVAWCHGTLLGAARSAQPEWNGLADIKADMAIARLAGPAGHDGERQPLIRREHPRPQAFLTPARLGDPAGLDIGQRITDRDDPDERFFLHVLHSLDETDPLGSVTAMHERLAAEPDQRFLLMNTNLLLASTWREPGVGATLLGRSDQLRVLAPVRLSAFGEMNWEVLPPRTVMFLSRQRYEAGQTG